MSEKIGSVVTMGNGLHVSTFTGPGGQIAVQLTPASPCEYLQLKPDQVRELATLLQIALSHESARSVAAHWAQVKEERERVPAEPRWHCRCGCCNIPAYLNNCDSCRAPRPTSSTGDS